MTRLRQFGPTSFGLDVSGEVYVETGLNRGDSLANACAHWSFRRLVGIEVNPESAEHCRRRFLGDARVQVLQGSSASLLAGVIDPAKRTVFWLDAHECGGAPETRDPQGGPCPLLAELRAIATAPWKHKPVILIDDAMCFCSAGEWRRRHGGDWFRQEDYPTFGDIFDALGGVDELFQFAVAYTPGDPGGVIYCF